MAAHPSPPAFRPAERLSSMTVRDAMQLGLFHCAPEDDLATVAQLMADQKVHCVVVAGITRRDHFGERLAWGIVSDIDLVCALRSDEPPAAGEVAGSEVVAVSPTDTLAAAVQLMCEHDTAHLVVASPDTGRPVGMLSTLDIARAVRGR
jgi:CBS domain-containing protein